MAKKYIFVRMPEDVFNIYKGIQIKMVGDVQKVTGKNVKIPMTRVFKAVASPDLNKNFIEINIADLVKLAKVRKK